MTRTYLTLPVFVEGNITLTPSDDYCYIIDLAQKYKYNTLSLHALNIACDFVKHIWVGTVNGVKAGVVFLCYIPAFNWWTLDAYKDDALLKSLDNKGNFSYRSGRLVMDWFFKNIRDELYTAHEKQNRGATIVCKRLGFKESGYIKDFIVLKARA